MVLHNLSNLSTVFWSDIYYCSLGMVFPSLMFPLEHSKTCSACSLLTPPPPTEGWRGESEAQKVRIMDWDNNNLLEKAMRWENEQ